MSIDDIKFITPRSCPLDCDIMTTTGLNGVDMSVYNPASAKRYSDLEREFGLKGIVTLHQVHGDEIVTVTEANFNAVKGVSADGLITTAKGVGLGILTADCFPVVLAGDVALSALHCGWRGVSKGIIDNAFRQFELLGDTPKYAYVGPGISKAAFEVKSDFIAEMANYADTERYLSDVDGKKYFDLQRLISNKLVDFGIESIDCADICTYMDDSLYSYRRTQGEKRRLLTLAYLKGR